MPDNNDRGEALASRKFLLSVLAMMVISLMSYFSIQSPAVQGILPTFVGGVLGVLGLYFTGNVANKHVVGKVALKTPSQTSQELSGDISEGEEK